MTRTSMRVGCDSPTRSNSRSCSTRSSLVCSVGLIVPTSSRKSVPRCACSKRPDALADGAGERAAHVAEQLGLEQRLRQRAAVDRDEPLVAARAVVVDRARDQLLAGAGLAVDQDRARRRGDRRQHLEQLAHDAALSDQPLEAVALLELRSQVRVLGAQAALLERAVHHVEQLVVLERLGDEVGGAALDQRHGVAHRAVAGHHDDDDVGVALQRRSRTPRAAKPGSRRSVRTRSKANWGAQRPPLLPSAPARRGSRGRRADRRCEAERRLVLDEQQMRFVLSHLAWATRF